MPSSTRWRIVCLANYSNQTGFNEVEMAESSGGTNECTGGTPSASASYGGVYAATGAFDGNYNSPNSWYGAGVRGAWIEYQFASAKDIVEFRLVRGDADSGGTPRFMAFQYYDGAAWVTEWLGFYDAWNSNTLVTFTKPTPASTYQHWGIRNTQGAGGDRDTVIVEMEMRDTVGGTDQTGSGTARGFRENGGSLASNAFDNNTGNYFYTGVNSMESFLSYDFGSPIAIGEYAIRADPASGNVSRAPGVGAVIASNDGLSYLELRQYNLVVADYPASAYTAYLPISGGGPPTPPPRRRQAVVC